MIYIRFYQTRADFEADVNNIPTDGPVSIYIKEENENQKKEYTFVPTPTVYVDKVVWNKNTGKLVTFTVPEGSNIDDLCLNTNYSLYTYVVQNESDSSVYVPYIKVYSRNIYRYNPTMPQGMNIEEVSYIYPDFGDEGAWVSFNNYIQDWEKITVDWRKSNFNKEFASFLNKKYLIGDSNTIPSGIYDTEAPHNYMFYGNSLQIRLPETYFSDADRAEINSYLNEDLKGRLYKSTEKPTVGPVACVALPTDVFAPYKTVVEMADYYVINTNDGQIYKIKTVKDSGVISKNPEDFDYTNATCVSDNNYWYYSPIYYEGVDEDNDEFSGNSGDGVVYVGNVQYKATKAPKRWYATLVDAINEGINGKADDSEITWYSVSASCRAISGVLSKGSTYDDTNADRRDLQMVAF